MQKITMGKFACVGRSAQWLLLLLVMIGTTVACTKNPWTNEIIQLTDSGLVQNEAVVASGQSVTIHPQLNIPARYANIRWSENGKLISRDSILKYTPNKNGRFKLQYTASNGQGSVEQEYEIVVRKYTGGYFVVNEGNYPAAGSINYYIPSENKLITDAVSDEQSHFGTTVVSGTIWKDRLYSTAKINKHITVTDLYDFKTVASIVDNAKLGQCHEFCGISDRLAVVSSLNGVFALSLDPLAIGERIGEAETAGNVYCDGTYLYVIYKNSGLVIYRISDFSKVKTVPGAALGFCVTPNGMIWAAGGGMLFRITPGSLDVQTIPLPESVALYANWEVWRSGIITASTQENAVYMASTEWSASGNQIFRYIDGDPSSLNQVFAQGAADDVFYGSAIRYDAVADCVVAIFIKSGWGENMKVNRLVYFDARTGAEKSRFTYPDAKLWFPADIVFEKKF